VRMHADQIDLTVDVVARLVAEQFPAWSGRPVRPVTSDGTVNALFRLGEDIVLRFPLLPARRAELVEEQENARRIAPHVPLEVPEPLALGEAGAGYPGPWAVYRWIPGTPATLPPTPTTPAPPTPATATPTPAATAPATPATATPTATATPAPATPAAATVGDLDAFARDLAGFVRALHSLDTGGRTWDGRGRGRPLPTQDKYVRSALAESTHLVDTGRLTRIWESCLAAAGDVTPAWIHADLMPGNLLVRDGRLAAVIDLGTVTVGDPAVDLMPAWNTLPPGPRDTYRRSLDADEATWARGRGWALVQAIVALPYYVDTNPGMAATARHTLTAILTDP
jgi:aminoglycoside phosphotransferase (APT) family kinase protein